MDRMNWNTKANNRAERLARVADALGPQRIGKRVTTEAVVALLEAALESGDRVCLEGNNQKQADFLALKTPRSAMVFGGLAGTVSGVSAGLAATDRKLVPYGALVATFHTGLGCLMGPSVLFLATKALVG